MRPAPCHPDRPHYSKGKCYHCYNTERNRKNSARVKQQAANAQFLALQKFLYGKVP